jgi:hypothetical protein
LRVLGDLEIHHEEHEEHEEKNLSGKNGGHRIPGKRREEFFAQRGAEGAEKR